MVYKSCVSVIKIESSFKFQLISLSLSVFLYTNMIRDNNKMTQTQRTRRWTQTLKT
jgi:hypothetical protein